jgi:hypothetical protein
LRLSWLTQVEAENRTIVYKSKNAKRHLKL